MYTIAIYVITIILLLISLIKDKTKTQKAIAVAAESAKSMLLQFLVLILLIGLTLTYVNEDMISGLLGNETGIYGLLVAAASGSVVIFPTMLAFPLVAELITMGAGYPQITMFLSTLTMIGIISFPLEKKFFGTKATVKRNILCLFFAFMTSLCIMFVM